MGIALLGWAQGFGWNDPAAAFRMVFWLTLIPGLLAVLAFLTLVHDPEHSPNPGLRLFKTLRGLPASSPSLVMRPLDARDVPPGRLYLCQLRSRTLPVAAAKFAALLEREIDLLDG